MQQTTAGSPELKSSNAVHTLLVLAIVVMGVALRLNNITTESVYWDEFSSLVHLRPPAGYTESPYFSQWEQTVIRQQAPSLVDFWVANRELDPATMPFYYTFEYFVWNYGRQSVVDLRLLSVFFSLCAFPFLYLLGRAMWGPAAGAVALFMFAASPVHVQFAQEIRMYALFAGFAAASAYTFFRVVENGGRWWIIHLAVNLLLLWTHPFAVWLPFTQGVFLILFHWPRWRFVLSWGFAHVALLIPSALYISSIQFFGRETTDDWMVIPGWRALVADIFADDCVGMTSQLWGRPDTFRRIFSEETAVALASARYTIGLWCAVFVTGLCALGAGIQGVRYARARMNNEQYDRAKWAAFLVMWAILPPLILLFLSHAWRPMLMPRYTMHCSMAFYLLAGACVASIGHRWLRILPAALIVLMYTYQQGLVLEGPHRTNWQGVRDYLKQNAKQDDFILVENWLWKRVFAYTMGPVPQVITYGTKLDNLAELARTWLDGAYPKDPANPEPRGLWIVYNNNYFNQAPAFELEVELAKRGMQWRNTYIHGLEGIWIYEVADVMTHARTPDETWQSLQSLTMDFQDASVAFHRYGDYANGVCFAEQGLVHAPDTARLYSYLGLNYMGMGQYKAARTAFDRAIRLAELEYPWTLINLGESNLKLGNPRRAIAPLTRAVEVMPQDLHARALLAQAYIESGRPWDAMAVLDIDIRNQVFVADQEVTHWNMVKLAAQEWAQMTDAVSSSGKESK